MPYSLILPLIFGWIAGWLVNYLAEVLPEARRINPGESKSSDANSPAKTIQKKRKLYRPACPNCQTNYSLFDYLFFHRCRNCGQKRRLRAILTPLVLTGVSIYVWLYPNSGLPYLVTMLLLTYLAVVFVIDLEHRVILHPVSLAGIFVGLTAGIILRGGQSVWHGIYTSLLGGAFGFGVMLVFYFGGELYVKYMAKKRGVATDEVALGFGDVNLAGILGLILGWPGIVLGLTYGILAAGVISLLIILGLILARKDTAFYAVPYAPFLILGAVFLLYLQ